MATIDRCPQIRCDNCGAVEDKFQDDSFRWVKPHHWGDVSITGPFDIRIRDLCKACNEAVYDAARKALDERAA